jgi:predicted nucleotidyltransferase
VEALPADWEVTRLARTLRDHLPDLRARHHIASLAVFGSYARNEQRPDSDLDLLVTFTRTPSFFDLVRAEDDVGALLGVRVDLVLRSELGPRLARYALREAVPV